MNDVQGVPTDFDSSWFARLSQELMADLDPTTTLERVCRRALAVVPTADFAANTVRVRRGRLRTQGHTDDLALQCDVLQYELGEGPCVDSALEDESFLVRSTADDPRWPRWGPAVARLGVHSIVSVQLPADVIDPERDPLGAINIYSRRVDGVDEADLARARVFAVHAANALVAAREVATLRDAVAARHQVGLAQGVLMRRYDLSADQAFEALQRYSSHMNVKLREVAARVVERGELPADYATAAGAAPGLSLASPHAEA